MRKDGVEVLLLGESEGGTSHLLRLMQKRGCHCSFATSGEAPRMLAQHGFDLVLSTIPLGQSHPLVLLLENSDCAVFYSCPVEDGCWWVPLTGHGRKCLGAPAIRPKEFGTAIDRAIEEIESRRITAAKERQGDGTMMMPARLKSILDQEHVGYLAFSHVPTYSAQYAASVMHVPGKEVAKTVVLRTGKDVLLAVLPASYQINLEKLSAAVGARVRLVEENECNGLFPDCEPGVFPAFGELYGLPVYLDGALAEDPEIILSAGTRSDAVRMGNADFVRMVKPKIRSFAENPRNKRELQEIG
jgi:Ala-tRNA(Pro) deacylase